MALNLIEFYEFFLIKLNNPYKLYKIIYSKLTKLINVYVY